MSKALICSVALAALVASGVVLHAADFVPGFGGNLGQQGDRDRGRGDRDHRGRVDQDRGRRDFDGNDRRRDEPRMCISGRGIPYV
jgi:hypothetical protein